MRDCPICGSKEKEVLFSVDMSIANLRMLPAKNDIVICKNCGFAFADNDSNQAAYDDYYKNHSVYAYDRDIKKPEEKEPDTVEYIEKYVDKSASIIDIGAGDGSLLKSLKDRGYKTLIGMDSDKANCKALEEKGVQAVCQSIFDELDSAIKRQYGAVVSTCVGEHIFDLKTYIENCLALLAEGGRFVIEVPAVEGFEKHYAELPNYFNQEHINYFSKNTLDRLMALSGFKRINDSDDSIYFIQPNGEYFLIGVYEKSDNVELPVCEETRKSIVNYYTDYQKHQMSLDEKIEHFIKDNKEVVLWGCGSFATQFFSKNQKMLESIIYAVDSNKAKQMSDFCGKTVYPVEKLLSDPHPVMIFSMLNSKDCVEELKAAGFKLPYLTIAD